MDSDRNQLLDLIARYAQAVDDRDVDRLVACFSPDATLEQNGGANAVQGRAAITNYFTDAFANRPALAGGASTHLLGNVLVTIDGDAASIETQAIACLAAPGRETVTLRGLRYSDRCVRSGGAWTIQRRAHRALWQCEAPGGLVG
jgi:uncharacterized protein (TIGR02246 family)